jgi:lipid-A-disaccharide synthase-like uncharacterized protein
MKESIDEIKNEVKAKWTQWNNVQNSKYKVALVFGLIGLVGLKIFTTVLTFDWLASFFN